MVTAISVSLNPKVGNQRSTRPPQLLASEGENGYGHRRRKSLDVKSRYLASSSSISTLSSSSSSTRSSSSSTSSSDCLKRWSSPLASRSNRPGTPSAIQRSQSVGRRLSATPGPVITRSDSFTFRGTPRLESTPSRIKGEPNTAHKMLPRSMSLSFQGEPYTVHASKKKTAPSSSVRKGMLVKSCAAVPATSSSGTDLKPNPLEHLSQWSSLRRPTCSGSNLDYKDQIKKLSGSGSNVIRALQDVKTKKKGSYDGRPTVGKKKKDEGFTGSLSSVGSGSLISDAESASSDNSTSGAEEEKSKAQRMARGISVPARFRQEATSCVQRSGLTISQSRSMNTGPSKLIAIPKNFGSESPIASLKGVANNRGQQSPFRRPIRPASPSRPTTPLVSSPLRGTSPSRVRFGAMASANNNLCNDPSILSFASDVRRLKIGEERFADAHMIRLLHNRQLQWRFANARAKSVLTSQRLNAETGLFNAWKGIKRLRDSVKAKRSEFQFLQENLKLIAVLQGQARYLEEWSSLEHEYSSCLLGAVEALRASTLRLPVVGGAKSNLQGLKDAICSAVDVMQGMASSVCYLLPKVGEVRCLSQELAIISAKESAMLQECMYLLSTIIDMQVTESSLRVHILQEER